jgi:NADH dehydrogenase
VSQIVILGAGYAGVQAALTLARLAPRHSIVLIDRLPYHQLITQLPAVAAGRIPKARAAIPLDRLLPPQVRHIQAEVTQVSPAPGRIETSVGGFDADWLVLGLGSVASDLGVAGALTHALPLKSVRDASRIFERIRALRASQPLTRVVIVGGGYTGTEVAGELTDASARRRGDGDLAVSIVQPDMRLLPQGNPKLSEAALRVLSRRSIAMRFGVWLKRVEADSVTLDPADSIPSDLTIWAARTRPAPAVRSILTWTDDGRITVDPYLRAEGSPCTFVVGDLASTTDYSTGTVLPASAQVAVPAGRRAAENMIAQMEGRPLEEFRERPLGEAVGLGTREGVAEVAGIVTTGRLALGVKRAALLRYLSRLGQPDLVRDYV